MARIITTTVLTPPIRTRARSEVRGRKCFTMSIATTLPMLLSAAAVPLIEAARIEAATSPFRPVGTSLLTITGKVLLASLPISSLKRM